MSPTQTILLQEERAASYWRSTAAAMCSSRCIAPRASAMQLGLDVIATDLGGNTDEVPIPAPMGMSGANRIWSTPPS